MKLTFDISATEFVTVRDILADIVPTECRVWVFGSRAKNQARFNSDLDLALESNGKLPPITLHRLKEAFNEAALAYRVDVLDINDVSEKFQMIIRQQAIVFPLAKSDKVPALRFPEFSGEWEEKRLGELGDIVTGKTPKTSDPSLWSGVIPFITPTDIDESKKYQRTTSRCISMTEKLRVLPSGAVLFTCIASIGKMCLSTEPSITNQQINSLVVRNSNDAEYVYYALKQISPKIKATLASTTLPIINKTEFSKFKVGLPCLLEQKKIAAFLSAIDTKIAQITNKKALLEQYKKGVMQKLFSQELRFKDAQGNDFPEWEEKRLGDFYEFKSTNSFSRDQLNYDGGTVQNIHYGDIHTKFKPKFDLIKEHIPFINANVDLSRISADKYCNEGDLVIADASEDYDDIGKTIELINLNNEKVLAGLHTLLARLTSKDIHIGFGTFLMACASVRKQIKIIAQGTKVLGISTGRMAKIKLPMPCHDEQQKIASFLSAIDTKINLVTTELDHAKTFKKGLLQQMFV